eukprot:c18624_g1_i2.p1 GENE.c18624_g1_i2~~c18624_g1_i2.p1  ORF type:complete len:899 (+),score=174.20 c18624_g1_i2:361-2697(+)
MELRASSSSKTRRVMTKARGARGGRGGRASTILLSARIADKIGSRVASSSPSMSSEEDEDEDGRGEEKLETTKEKAMYRFTDTRQDEREEKKLETKEKPMYRFTDTRHDEAEAPQPKLRARRALLKQVEPVALTASLERRQMALTELSSVAPPPSNAPVPPPMAFPQANLNAPMASLGFMFPMAANEAPAGSGFAQAQQKGFGMARMAASSPNQAFQAMPKMAPAPQAPQMAFAMSAPPPSLPAQPSFSMAPSALRRMASPSSAAPPPPPPPAAYGAPTMDRAPMILESRRVDMSAGGGGAPRSAVAKKSMNAVFADSMQVASSSFMAAAAAAAAPVSRVREVEMEEECDMVLALFGEVDDYKEAAVPASITFDKKKKKKRSEKSEESLSFSFDLQSRSVKGDRREEPVERLSRVSLAENEFSFKSSSFTSAREQKYDPTSDLLLLDVTPLSLGVALADGSFFPIIKRNTTIPCSSTASLLAPGDGGVLIEVFEGERTQAQLNHRLGAIELHNPNPTSRTITVKFSLDANGVLTVTAVWDKVEDRLVITNDSGRLRAEDIARMVQEAEADTPPTSAPKLVLPEANEVWLPQAIARLAELVAQNSITADSVAAALSLDSLAIASISNQIGVADVNLAGAIALLATIVFARQHAANPNSNKATLARAARLCLAILPRVAPCPLPQNISTDAAADLIATHFASDGSLAPATACERWLLETLQTLSSQGWGAVANTNINSHPVPSWICLAICTVRECSSMFVGEQVRIRQGRVGWDVAWLAE